MLRTRCRPLAQVTQARKARIQATEISRSSDSPKAPRRETLGTPDTQLNSLDEALALAYPQVMRATYDERTYLPRQLNARLLRSGILAEP